MAKRPRRKMTKQKAKARVARMEARRRPAEIKREKRIPVADAFMRFRVWLYVASFLFLLLLEVGLQWREVQIFPRSIGGYRTHYTAHFVTCVVFLVATFLMFGLRLPLALIWRKHDFDWLRKSGGYLRKYSPVPPADRLNAGQKLFALFALLFSALVGLSGLLIHQPTLMEPHLFRSLCSLHFLSLLILTAGSFFYVYLFYAATPGRFSMLTSGTVTEKFLKLHHPLWYEKLRSKLERLDVKHRLAEHLIERHKKTHASAKAEGEDVLEMEVLDEDAVQEPQEVQEVAVIEEEEAEAVEQVEVEVEAPAPEEAAEDAVAEATTEAEAEPEEEAPDLPSS